jgi:hypothetical protein
MGVESALYKPMDAREQVLDLLAKYKCDGVFLWGVAMEVAREHPDWTFWQVVSAVAALSGRR